MDMSYKEKSLLASLGATLLVFGWYFYQVFSNQMFNIGHEFTFNDIFRPIILIVVLEIIIQSFLAGKDKNKEDERDALIEFDRHFHEMSIEQEIELHTQIEDGERINKQGYTTQYIIYNGTAKSERIGFGDVGHNVTKLSLIHI